LGDTHWQNHAARFVFGGLVTAVAGLIAHMYGPVIGGLFLAFPASLPASLTLIAQHECERKAKPGMNGAVRGRLAAALDALGAAWGSLGLLVFSVLTWQQAPHYRPTRAITHRAGHDGSGVSISQFDWSCLIVAITLPDHRAPPEVPREPQDQQNDQHKTEQSAAVMWSTPPGTTAVVITTPAAKQKHQHDDQQDKHGGPRLLPNLQSRTRQTLET
jgi:hypothetical protein